MDLRDVKMSDLPLYRALLTDPAMMSELGGPLPGDSLEDKLRGIVEDVRAGAVWYSVIDVDGQPAGTVCIWDHEQAGEPISEIGWMVLPAFQGRGIASEAVRSILEAARARGRWKTIHAFPGVTNGPSNSICRKSGFTQLQEQDVCGREIEYAGRILRCNHWVIDLATPT